MRDEPEKIFTHLRRREITDEAREALWTRVLEDIRERKAEAVGTGAGFRRASWIGGLAFAATLLLAVLIVTGVPDEGERAAGEAPVDPVTGSDVAGPPEASDLVVLAAPRVDPDAGPAAVTGGDGADLTLDVRLLDLDGSGKSPAGRSTLGAGGADVIGDVRADLRAIAPEGEFLLLGSTTTGLDAGVADLSSEHRLSFDAEVVPADTTDATDPDRPRRVRLSDVQLTGTELQSVAGELVLEEGRVYLLGVGAPDATGGRVILAIRIGSSTDSGGEPRRRD